jgi:hypothetical protein
MVPLRLTALAVAPLASVIPARSVASAAAPRHTAADPAVPVRD